MKKIISSILILASIILVGCKKDVKPESIVIDYSDNSVLVGEELTLTISSPTAKANLKVKWAVSDATIATVSGSGVVKGVKVGTVEVTATSTSDATKSDKALIYVIDQVTKEYRAPIVQLIKFSKDENVLAKFGAWRQAYIEKSGADSAKSKFFESLSSWIDESKPLLGEHIPASKYSQESWLTEVAETLVYSIDRGLSFAYLIGNIDDYKDHFLEGEDTLIEEGYTDIKVVELYKKVTLYDATEDDFCQYYYFAIGKKGNKYEILEYSWESYFYTALDYANNYFGELTYDASYTISEVQLTELPSNFDYYLDPENYDWRYDYDIETRKAYKGFSSLNGYEITRYILIAARKGNSNPGLFEKISEDYDSKYTTALSRVISYMGDYPSSSFTTITDSSVFDQDDFNDLKQKYGQVEIIKFVFPIEKGTSFYFAVVNATYGYQIELEKIVITSDTGFLNILLEWQRSYVSYTYSSIAENEFSASIKSDFDDLKEEYNLTKIIGYKVIYSNQFVNRTELIYFFQDTKGNYLYPDWM